MKNNIFISYISNAEKNLSQEVINAIKQQAKTDPLLKETLFRFNRVSNHDRNHILSSLNLSSEETSQKFTAFLYEEDNEFNLENGSFEDELSILDEIKEQHYGTLPQLNTSAKKSEQRRLIGLSSSIRIPTILNNKRVSAAMAAMVIIILGIQLLKIQLKNTTPFISKLDEVVFYSGGSESRSTHSEILGHMGPNAVNFDSNSLTDGVYQDCIEEKNDLVSNEEPTILAQLDGNNIIYDSEDQDYYNIEIPSPGVIEVNVNDYTIALLPSLKAKILYESNLTEIQSQTKSPINRKEITFLGCANKQATSTENAWHGHGLFSYYLLEGLSTNNQGNESFVSIEELSEYLENSFESSYFGDVDVDLAINNDFKPTIISFATHGEISDSQKYTEPAMPQASFSFTLDEGCSPAIVELQNTSLNADNYSWQISGENPEIIIDTISLAVAYGKLGIYDISLSAINECGIRAVERENLVNVISPPKNAFPLEVNSTNSYKIGFPSNQTIHPFPNIDEGYICDTRGQQKNYAELPFSDGFEAATLNTYWSWSFADSQLTNIVKLSSAIKPKKSNAFGIFMGKRCDQTNVFATNALDLHLDSTDHNQIKLGFWIWDFEDNTNPQDGIYFSDDGGVAFSKVIGLDKYNRFFAFDSIHTLDVVAFNRCNADSATHTFRLSKRPDPNFSIDTSSVYVRQDGLPITDMPSGGNLVYQWSVTPTPGVTISNYLTTEPTFCFTNIGDYTIQVLTSPPQRMEARWDTTALVLTKDSISYSCEIATITPVAAYGIADVFIDSVLWTLTDSTAATRFTGEELRTESVLAESTGIFTLEDDNSFKRICHPIININGKRLENFSHGLAFTLSDRAIYGFLEEKKIKSEDNLKLFMVF